MSLVLMGYLGCSGLCQKFCRFKESGFRRSYPDSSPLEMLNPRFLQEIGDLVTPQN
jgi:hypothetical protein